MAVDEIDGRCQSGFAFCDWQEPFAGDPPDPRESDIAEGAGAGASNGSGHICDAVVDDTVDDIGGVGMCCGSGGFEAAALVDADIDNDRSGFHQFKVFCGHEPRSPGAGDQYAADDKVCAAELFADIVAVAEQGVDVGGHDIVEVTQAFEVDIEDNDVGLETSCNAGGVFANDAAAKDGDVGWLDPGDSTEQDTAAFLGAFEEFGALLNTHASSNLAHGSQQWQVVATAAKRFVRYGSDTGLEQATGEVFVGGEVEVGEDDLSASQERPFGGKRLLDLDDQISGSEDFGVRTEQGGSAGGVIVVCDAASEASTAFDEHLMAVAYQFFNAAREHGDAVLVRFNFPWQTDVHSETSVRGQSIDGIREVGRGQVAAERMPAQRESSPPAGCQRAASGDNRCRSSLGRKIISKSRGRYQRT